MFQAGLAVLYLPETGANPALAHLGLDQAAGNLEGKDVRFGADLSALWAEATTAASNGSVNSMHDSFAHLPHRGDLRRHPLITPLLGRRPAPINRGPYQPRLFRTGGA